MKNDLIVLVADKNMEYALKGGLSRPKRLGIRTVSTKFISNPHHDSGVRAQGASTLALERGQYDHALLVMDFEGSGSPLKSALALEEELDKQLRATWGEAAKAIVIEPELDIWMWGSDNKLHDVIGRPPDAGARDWLRREGFVFTEGDKPTRPKEALEALMRKLRKPRSSAIYEQIASSISLSRCADPAFRRLHETLRRWFPLD